MTRKDNMPLMVYAALLGINSRRAGMVFVWVCVAIAAGALAGTVILGMQYGAEMTIPPAVACLGFLGSAAWYSHAVKWVDKHSAWEK